MSTFDLSCSDEVLARWVVDSHPEGIEIFDRKFTYALAYEPRTRDAARYARVFALARQFTSSAERQATFLMEQIFGLRNMSGRWDIDLVTRLVDDEAVALIASLPDSSRKPALLSQRLYHGALVDRAAGRFQEEACKQDAAARLAGEQTVKGLVCTFAAGVARVYHAVCQADWPAVDQALFALRDQARTFDNLDESDPVGKRWKLADRHAHLMEVHWLSGVPQDWVSHLGPLERLPEPLFSTYEHWRVGFQAVAHFEAGRLARAIPSIDEVLFKNRHPSSTLFAMLILARVQLRQSLQGIARETLRAIIHYPTHDGHCARAVAARELASLGVAS